MLMVLLTGCGAVPDTQYFVLHPTNGPQAAAPHRVHLAQFRLPDMVSRPQMLVRTSDQTVDLIEFQRWAEPLDRMAARIFLEDLAQRGMEPRSEDGESDPDDYA
jgi:uncharacterized lipoprotein YmbA